MQQWMIYGANGYTGQLLARAAAQRGLRPILAGRNRQTISALANELNLPFRCFDLNRPQQICEGLQDIQVVLHCARSSAARSRSLLCLGRSAKPSW